MGSIASQQWTLRKIFPLVVFDQYNSGSGYGNHNIEEVKSMFMITFLPPPCTPLSFPSPSLSFPHTPSSLHTSLTFPSPSFPTHTSFLPPYTHLFPFTSLSFPRTPPSSPSPFRVLVIRAKVLPMPSSTFSVPQKSEGISSASCCVGGIDSQVSRTSTTPPPSTVNRENFMEVSPQMLPRENFLKILVVL